MSNMAARVPGGEALEKLSIACRTIAILLLATMSTLIVAQVAGRNLFDLGMPWADELSRFCGVALVFFGIPLLALRGLHVAVDMVPQMLPPAGRRFCNILAEMMILVFAAMALWSLWAFLGRAWKFATPTLGIPNWVYYAPAAVCFALLAAITIVRLIAQLRGGDLRPDIEVPLS